MPFCIHIIYTFKRIKVFLHCLIIKTRYNMFNEKAGVLAGQIWEALNEKGALTGKELKKIAKVKSEKELYLGLGWLLREDKLTIEETEKDIQVCLK